MLHSVTLGVGDAVELLHNDLDLDEFNRERHTQAGTVGRVFMLDQDGPGGGPRYHVEYPNGAWMIYHDDEVFTLGRSLQGLSGKWIAKVVQQEE